MILLSRLWTGYFIFIHIGKKLVKNRKLIFTAANRQRRTPLIKVYGGIAEERPTFYSEKNP
jgi:hypothetical protein